MPGRQWTDLSADERCILRSKCEVADNWLAELQDKHLYDFISRVLDIGASLVQHVTNGFCLPNPSCQEWVDAILALKLSYEEGSIIRKEFLKGDYSFYPHESSIAKVDDVYGYVAE